MKISKGLLAGRTGLSSPHLAALVPGSVLIASQAMPEPQQRRAVRDMAERARRDEMEQIAGWIRDQLERDAKAIQAGIEVLNVTYSWRRFHVRILQWHQHGVGGPVMHELTLPQGSSSHVEDEVRRATTARFSRMLERQAMLTEQLGPARTVEAKEIDLSLLTIEKPLLKALRLIHGDDVGPAVREIVAKQGIIADYRREKRIEEAGFTAFSAEMNRRRLSGSFTVPGTSGTVRWVRGSIAVLDGASYPESLLLSLRGRPLREILEHPLLDPEMVVTAVNAMRRDGIDGISITVRGFETPMPAEWSE